MWSVMIKKEFLQKAKAAVMSLTEAQELVRRGSTTTTECPRTSRFRRSWAPCTLHTSAAAAARYWRIEEHADALDSIAMSDNKIMKMACIV